MPSRLERINQAHWTTQERMLVDADGIKYADWAYYDCLRCGAHVRGLFLDKHDEWHNE